MKEMGQLKKEVAAVIAWYLPVRKKKEKTISVENTSMNTEVEKHDT